MRVLVDATTLIALGGIAELDLLADLDGDLVVPPAVADEVTSEPAATNLGSVVERHDVETDPVEPDWAVERAAAILEEPPDIGDVRLVAGVLANADRDEPVGVVSDDRRVRTVCSGLGATVTGTVGVLVRAVEERGLTADEGRALVRRVDGRGLHMTGELRDTAYELVDEAAEE